MTFIHEVEDEEASAKYNPVAFAKDKELEMEYRNIVSADHEKSFYIFLGGGEGGSGILKLGWKPLNLSLVSSLLFRS